jgi:hypothetical protein
MGAFNKHVTRYEVTAVMEGDATIQPFCGFTAEQKQLVEPVKNTDIYIILAACGAYFIPLA